MPSKNQRKFEALKELGLPLGQYAITGSGPMGIRNLKEIGDIDILVTEELWAELAKKYRVVDENGIRSVQFPGGIIEAFGVDSFYSFEKTLEDPTFKERIENAELIDGLPFESLKHVLYYKNKMGRDKDLRDIELIQEYLDC